MIVWFLSGCFVLGLSLVVPAAALHPFQKESKTTVARNLLLHNSGRFQAVEPLVRRPADGAQIFVAASGVELGLVPSLTLPTLSTTRCSFIIVCFLLQQLNAIEPLRWVAQGAVRFAGGVGGGCHVSAHIEPGGVGEVGFVLQPIDVI